MTFRPLAKSRGRHRFEWLMYRQTVFEHGQVSSPSSWDECMEVRDSSFMFCTGETYFDDDLTLLLTRLNFKYQSALAFIDLHRGAVGDLACQQLLGEWILQIALHCALQRPRSVDRIISDLPEPA